MVEVMKIMVTSFKRSHACTATLSAPNPAAGHHWPTPLLETPGHTQASLSQSLVGSLLLTPGSWRTKFCCALWESISQSCVSSGSSMVRLMATSSKRFYAIPKSAASRALSLWQSTDDPYLHRDAQTQFCLSLCGGLWVLVCTRFVWALLASLAGMGFDSKCKFAPPTILWDFSFALGRGVSPHSHSRAYHLTGVSLTLDVGYLLSGACCSSTPLQHHMQLIKQYWLKFEVHQRYEVYTKWLLKDNSDIWVIPISWRGKTENQRW